MALFDTLDKMSSKMTDVTNKVSDLAKNLGDKAGDAFEVTKLTVKIAGEREAASAKLKELGTYYYNKHAAGASLEVAVEDLCLAIDENYRTVAQCQAEIERMKAGDPDVVAEARGEEVPETDTSVPGEKFCLACGAKNIPSANFCSACGTKLS